jgi:hypothetical protein
MSFKEKFDELIAGAERVAHKVKAWCEHSCDTGYGSELPESITGALVLLAWEIDKLKEGGVAAVDPAALEAAVTEKVKAIVDPFLQQLQELFASRMASGCRTSGRRPRPTSARPTSCSTAARPAAANLTCCSAWRSTSTSARASCAGSTRTRRARRSPGRDPRLQQGYKQPSADLAGRRGTARSSCAAASRRRTSSGSRASRATSSATTSSPTSSRASTSSSTPGTARRIRTSAAASSARPTGRPRPRAVDRAALGGLARSQASEAGQGRRAALVPDDRRARSRSTGPGPHEVNGRAGAGDVAHLHPLEAEPTTRTWRAPITARARGCRRSCAASTATATSRSA